MDIGVFEETFRTPSGMAINMFSEYKLTDDMKQLTCRTIHDFLKHFDRSLRTKS